MDLEQHMAAITGTQGTTKVDLTEYYRQQALFWHKAYLAVVMDRPYYPEDDEREEDETPV